MKSNRFLARTAVALAATILGSACAHAQFVFTVSVNTAALVGNNFGPYMLDFQLNSGSGSNTNSNTATISNFVFTGGTAPTTEGFSTGSTSFASSPLSLTLDASPSTTFNELTLGALSSDTTNVTFTVDLSQNVGTISPDQFIVDLVDTNGGTQSLATNASNGYSVVQVNITGSNTLSDVQTYTTQEIGNDEFDGGSPGAYGSIVTTPEPTTWALLLGGTGLLALRLRRLRR